MPHVTVADGARLFVADESNADPWSTDVKTVMMIHGMGESADSWFAWVPYFLREYRVLRIDLRGLGRSDVPDPGYPWSIDLYSADVAAALEAVGVSEAHIVGAKLGGAIGLSLAAEYPAIARSVTVVGPIIRAADTGNHRWLKFSDAQDPGSVDLKASENREIVAQSMQTRLGPDVSRGEVDWWTDMYCQTNPRVMAEVVSAAQAIDLEPVLHRISAPTLVIAAEESGLHTPEDMRNWIAMIPRGEIEVWPGTGFHLAAIQPDRCAMRTLDFIRQVDRD